MLVIYRQICPVDHSNIQLPITILKWHNATTETFHDVHDYGHFQDRVFVFSFQLVGASFA